VIHFPVDGIPCTTETLNQIDNTTDLMLHADQPVHHQEVAECRMSKTPVDSN
jgi:hypothetical protein